MSDYLKRRRWQWPVVVLAVAFALLGQAGVASAVSTPPTGGTDAGVVAIDTAVDGSSALSVVSCPTTTWCMAGGDNGDVVVYSGGAWGAPTNVFSVKSGAVDGLSCPTTTFCMAVSYIGGTSIYSGGTWSAPVKNRAGWGVSCPTAKFCTVERDGFGDLDLWGSGKWSLSYNTENDPSKFAGIGQTSGPVSCLPGSTDDCMYVDNSDYYNIYNGTKWTHMAQVPGSGTAKVPGTAGSVSCSGEPTSFTVVDGMDDPTGNAPTCTVVDLAGNAYTFEPDSSEWTESGNVDISASDPDLTGVSCVYARCAAVDHNKNVLYQNLFSGPVATWSAPFALGTKGVPTDISCASLSFCVAVTASSEAVILDPSS